MAKIQFGIMGAGSIARRMARVMASSDCAEVTAVASKSPDRAAAFARELGIPAACSYDELLSRQDVEAVYVATTHNFHYENVKACLMAGKHVLCEKPMVLTEANAKELFALAKEKGLFLMEAMWTRYLPSMQRARQWIEEGKIGKVQAVTGMIAFKADTDLTTRLMDPALAGGGMYDIGVYAIEITTYLVGERVQNVMGSVRRDSRTGVDTNCNFILQFEGADACLQCVFTANAKEYLIVTGTEGYIEIPTAHINDEAYLYDVNRDPVEHCKIPFKGGDGFIYEVEEAARCIREGKLWSDTMAPQVTIECAGIFDSLLGTK